MNELISTAKDIQRECGGKIFAFPIEPDNPHSKYALVMDVGGNFKAFDKPMDVEEEAEGVLYLINLFNEENIKCTYEEDVRFIFYEAQRNAPSISMRKLKKGNHFERIS